MHSVGALYTQRVVLLVRGHTLRTVGFDAVTEPPVAYNALRRKLVHVHLREGTTAQRTVDV